MNSRDIFAKIVENWPAKVFSIALAMVLSVFHRMNSLTERLYSVPLVLESQSNLVPASSYAKMIRISVKGEEKDISLIQEDNIEAYVDLSRYNAPGNYQAPVQIRKSGMALELNPLTITVDPASISLSLDHKISKIVQLKMNLHGEVEPGFLLNSYSLNPPQVIIDGPSSHVSNITELETESVDLGGRDEDFTVMVNIMNRDPLFDIRGNGLTEFSGSVSRVVSVRNIQNVPVRITGLNEIFTGVLESYTATLHLEGRNQDELDQFVLPDDFLSVDCSAIREPGTYVLTILGEIPPNLVFFTEPPEMKVEINNLE